MRLYPFEGPREEWQHKVAKLNKIGLLEFIDGLVQHFKFVGINLDRNSLLRSIESCRRWGKDAARWAETEKLLTDPRSFYDEKDRRARSAKRAAKRRKAAKK